MASTGSPTPLWRRIATSGWLLSPILVLALIVGTYEGYAAYTRHQKTTYARGGAFGVIPTPAAQSGTATTGQRRPPKLDRTAAPSATPSATRMHQSSPSATGRQTTATPQRSAPSAATAVHSPRPTPTRAGVLYNQPTPGAYTLSVTGEEQAKFGPFSPCHTHFPAYSTLDVHHATGESKSSYDFDLRFYPGKPNKHDERHILAYDGDSVSLTYEQDTVTCFGVKQSSVVDYSPAQVRVAGPLRVGATWRNKGGGADRTETGTSQVVKQSTMKFKHRSYRVYEITTKLTLTGSETGYRNQTWWYAPELGMPLKFGETLHGARKGGSYTSSYTATVISGP